MTLKILSVDDSKAVRIIIKRSIKNYDVDVIEAANGVEGLAAASKEKPDLILLDVTMPIMDGVEMLTKLKADSELKSIPVVMLTAEAGRENVLKIAKIGIRDYIVKPFKEEVLVEKIGRIVDLRPASDASKKQKSLTDACDILVVEDKPVIIQQITEGIKHTPWKVHSASSTGETIDFCEKVLPDLIIISLSLPNDSAISTFRLLRSNMKTKYVPIFGLAVKTAIDEQKNAQQAGFTSVITKPIDFEDLETKISKAINLDTSQRYFKVETDYLLIYIPKKISKAVITEISVYCKQKISQAVDNGAHKIIFDAHELESIDMDLIKLIDDAMKICQELTLQYAIVGNNTIAPQCKKFTESQNWKFFDSIESAKTFTP